MIIINPSSTGAECEEAIRATHVNYLHDFEAEPFDLEYMKRLQSLATG